MMRFVSHAATSSVSRLKSTFDFRRMFPAAPQCQEDAAGSGMPRANRFPRLIFPEFFHVLQIQRIEGLANWKKKMPITNTPPARPARPPVQPPAHAVGGAGGGEEQAVSRSPEADHLGIALLRVIIMRKASSTQARAMPRVERITVPEQLRDGLRQVKEKITSTMPISMVVGCDHRLHVAIHVQLFHEPEKNQGMAITLSTRVSAAE